MAEGYREMAEENRRLAEEAFPCVSETILKYTEWDEVGCGQVHRYDMQIQNIGFEEDSI